MSFIAPLGLALSALALPLLALYFLKIRRRRVRVPSLMLWDQFVKSEQLASPFQKFRRHLLLLLQLLLLLLVVFAFARPYIRGQFQGGRAVVLVVDTSASMGATDEQPHRLAAAVLRAKAAVDNLTDGDEALVVEAGPKTRVVSSFSSDKSEIRAGLNALAVRQAEGGLRDGVQLALSLANTRSNVEILVFTDGGHEAVSELGGTKASLYVQHVGFESANVGIVAMDLRASPASELDRQLFVTAQNFGSAPTDASLQIYVNDKLEAHREVRLTPGETEPLVFELPGSEKEKSARG